MTLGDAEMPEVDETTRRAARTEENVPNCAKFRSARMTRSPPQHPTPPPPPPHSMFFTPHGRSLAGSRVTFVSNMRNILTANHRLVVETGGSYRPRELEVDDGLPGLAAPARSAPLAASELKSIPTENLSSLPAVRARPAGRHVRLVFL